MIKIKRLLYNIIKKPLFAWKMGFYAKHFPMKHVRLSVQNNGKYSQKRVPDIKNPVLFDEKLLWLKYYVYNRSKLVSMCYDKYLVREYVKSCGLNHILNELIIVWSSISQIDLSVLPDEYVIKLSNGSGSHVFKNTHTQLDLDTVKNKLQKASNDRKVKFRVSGDILALKMPQHVIVERYIKSTDSYEVPPDYKFYCFNGEPMYILYIQNRYRLEGFEVAFLDVNFNNRNDLYSNASLNDVKKPKCLDKMIEYARILSNKFPFVRVDFYVENEEPIFGELTFTPAASFVLYHTHNLEGLKEMGNLIDLKPKKKFDFSNL